MILLSPCISAHSGRTDSNGGHYDNSTGSYHYHHGYPAHTHYDKDGDGDIDCPYYYKSNTNYSNSTNIKNYVSVNSSENSTTDWSRLCFAGFCFFLFVLIADIVFMLTLLRDYSKCSNEAVISSFFQKISLVLPLNYNSSTTNTPKQNYTHIDTVLQTSEQIENIFKDTKQAYIDSTSSVYRNITISLFLFVISFLPMLLMAPYIFSMSLSWLWFWLSVVITFFVWLTIYKKILYFCDKKTNDFLSTIKDESQNRKKILLHSLTDNVTDIYSFFGIPSDVYLTDHLQEKNNIRNYGTLTRYITPHGKCYHKKGCSSAFIPVNLYHLIYNRSHLSPCQRCCWDENNISLPSWYLYYMKWVTMIKELEELEHK